MINYKVIHQSMVYHLVLGLIFRVCRKQVKKRTACGSSSVIHDPADYLLRIA